MEGILRLQSMIPDDLGEISKRSGNSEYVRIDVEDNCRSIRLGMTRGGIANDRFEQLRKNSLGV